MSVAPADLEVGKEYNIFMDGQHYIEELKEKTAFGQGQYYKLRFGEEDLYSEGGVITINTKRQPDVTFSKIRKLHSLLSDKITKPNRSIHHYHELGHYIPERTPRHINRTLTIRKTLNDKGILPEIQHEILKFNSKAGGSNSKTGRSKSKASGSKRKTRKR